MTRRLTLDYGLRYDYQPPMHELHDRMAMFAPSIANPSAGGLLGRNDVRRRGHGPLQLHVRRDLPLGIRTARRRGVPDR